MRRDYAGRYAGIYRRSGQGRFSGGAGWSKAMGVLITVVMLAGLGVSIWFGWAVRTGLGELQKENKTRQELSKLHEKLATQRQALMKEDRIEAAAAKLGLFPPRRQQVYRP